MALALNHLEQTTPLPPAVLVSEPNGADDEQLLSTLPQSILTAVKSLKTAIDETFRSSISDVVLNLPSRRVHILRPQMQAIARAIFPDFCTEKAVIHYDIARRKSCQIVRAERDAEKARKKALHAGFAAQEAQGPWAGQKADPVSLHGPSAFPMPVKIGEEKHFKDCFSFLHANTDPKRFVVGQSVADEQSYNLTAGEELIWKTPMVEFERGVVYVDGRLDLCKMVVGPTHIKLLMESLESNNIVKHFLLGNNVISATGALSIANFIQRHPDAMETWYLAGNHIKAAGFRQLVESMVTSKSITNVWLKRNPLTPDSINSLAQLILNTSNLRTLDLENTELGDEGVARLFSIIKGQAFALQNVFLNANGVGEKGAAAVAAALESGWNPESLMLASNPIGDAGAEKLARAFRSNTSLIRVGLQSNGYTSAGISTISDSLSKHPTIRSVVFAPSLTTMVHGQRYNHIGDEALPGLKNLIGNPSLCVLELGRTSFSAEAVDEIRDAVSASNLCHFQAYHANEGQSCSLRVHQQIACNVERFFGTSVDEFKNGLGLRLLRNSGDVRLIDSVYRTRDKRIGFKNIIQDWEEDDPTWAMVDADWDF